MDAGPRVWVVDVGARSVGAGVDGGRAGVKPRWAPGWGQGTWMGVGLG